MNRCIFFEAASRMKIRIGSADPENYVRATSKSLNKVSRNFQMKQRFANAREYKRSLNFAKMENIYAKPFFCSLEGHEDRIVKISRDPKSISTVLTASVDGSIVCWDLISRQRKCVYRTGKILRDACYDNYRGGRFLSVDNGENIKQWKVKVAKDFKEYSTDTGLTMEHMCKSNLRTVDAGYGQDSLFATGGDKILVWDFERVKRLSKIKTEESCTYTCLRFNPIETNIFCATSNDSGVSIFDQRANILVEKLILDAKSNIVSWNPIEPFTFTVSNDDTNCYSFDVRALNAPVVVHRGHVKAALDVCYSPTGREFASVSLDRTIRIFRANSSRSRDVYHTRRMLETHSVAYTLDNKYILSGSDDSNLRLWLTNRSEPLVVESDRHKSAINYRKSLIKKYRYVPEVSRILFQRKTPKLINTLTKQSEQMRISSYRKELKRRQNGAPLTEINKRDLTNATKKKTVRSTLSGGETSPE